MTAQADAILSSVNAATLRAARRCLALNGERGGRGAAVIDRACIAVDAMMDMDVHMQATPP